MLAVLPPAPEARYKAPITPTGRLRLTLKDVLAMREAGVLPPESRFELFDGELLPMPDEGDLHIDALTAVYEWLLAQFGTDYAVHMRAPINLAEDTQLAPDLAVWPKGIRAAEMDQNHALLLVEITDTTKRYDLKVKAARYARAGVREYWALDVNARRLWAHRRPLGQDWAEKRAVVGDEPVSPLFAPQAELRVSELAF